MKRGVVVCGIRTSATLEQAFWEGLKEIADERGDSVTNVIAQIEEMRGCPNLSSAIRVFVLGHFEIGHHD
ncbi:ribbon-helix-helix domain-containing protein [Tardiphaga sp. 862_B3_N4_1]|uniref:ribbon-helix-helix domain-containing protein n=1 Tax=Tardiphaga sp. 862_B3_N4_1 TaxID=3240764 RepID=UPI003F298057